MASSFTRWFQKSAPPPRARQEVLFDDDFLRKLESLALVSRRVLSGNLRAEQRSKKKGSGVEFADHRQYTLGDDFRFVDWNIYQRFGRLLVRLYQEEEDLTVYFLIDCSASMSFGQPSKFDQARRLCAALAYVALSNLDRVSIVGLHERGATEVPPTRGKRRIFKLLRFLEQLESGGRTQLQQQLQSFVARHKRRGLAIVLSDLYDPAGFEGAINVLRYNRFEPYVLQLLDPPELVRGEGLRGDVSVIDCETLESREVTVTDALLEKLAQAHEEYQASIHRFCTRSQVPWFPARADEPFDEVVLKVMRRTGAFS